MHDVDEIRALKRELAGALKRRVEDVPAIEKRLSELGGADPVAVDAPAVEKRAPGRPKKAKAE